MASSEKSKLADVLTHLPSDKVDMLIDVLAKLLDEKLREVLPSKIDVVLHKLGYSEEVTGLVHLLAAKSGDSHEEVLRKALTLYGVALDAGEKGNRIAILSPNDDILREIVGFDATNLIPEPLAK